MAGSRRWVHYHHTSMVRDKKTVRTRPTGFSRSVRNQFNIQLVAATLLGKRPIRCIAGVARARRIPFYIVVAGITRSQSDILSVSRKSNKPHRFDTFQHSISVRDSAGAIGLRPMFCALIQYPCFNPMTSLRSDILSAIQRSSDDIL
jgi:hypothetical protein